MLPNQREFRGPAHLPGNITEDRVAGLDMARRLQIASPHSKRPLRKQLPRASKVEAVERGHGLQKDGGVLSQTP